MEEQETQRPDLLANVEKVCGYPKDTPIGESEDISEKCLLGKWLIEEPYALIGHVRFCEGLLRLEPLIAKKFEMKGSEKSRQSLLDEWMKRRELIKRLEDKGWYLKRHGAEYDIYTNGKQSEPIPRHPDINERLARSIIKRLGL